jgi:peroxiredoxin Q/BCP
MSFDTPAEQKRFADEQGFPYRLLCDTDRSVGAAYEAVRGPDEKYPDFPRRITYLIDPAGTIAATYDLEASGADLSSHASEVLADLRRLQE